MLAPAPFSQWLGELADYFHEQCFVSAAVSQAGWV